MCGRYTLHSPAKDIATLFRTNPPKRPWEPRYNLAPTQAGLVVRNTSSGRTLSPLRWGLVPHWADDPSIGNRLINARAESVATKRAFRSAFARRRCLVPADGFYEWQATGAGKPKQPYLIRRRDGRPLAFAGLWDRWARGEQPIDSYTIITGEPNALLRRLHNRMPVILPEDAWRAWLGEEQADRAHLQRLRVPCPADDLEAVPVSRMVNRPANESPECVDAVGEALRTDEDHDDGQVGLFG